MNLSDYRQQIDVIDAEILQLLKKRSDVVVKLGELKQTNQTETVDPAREAEIMNRIQGFCSQNQLPYQLVQTIFNDIFALSYHLQS